MEGVDKSNFSTEIKNKSNSFIKLKNYINLKNDYNL